MHPRRALLYVPGDDRRKIEIALAQGVDSVCLDLEEAVAFKKKDFARKLVARLLQELDFGKAERCVRINRVGSGLEKDDLNAVLAAGPGAIVLPGVESTEQVQWVSGEIKSYESAHGLTIGKIRLLIVVETARGILNLGEIASADERLEAILFDADDFAASIGATRSRTGLEVLYARSAIVTTCAARGLQALDMVSTDLKEVNLKVEAAQGAAMGFSGKQVDHPAQVGPVQTAFTRLVSPVNTQ